MGFGIDEFSQGQSAVNGDEEKDSIYSFVLVSDKKEQISFISIIRFKIYLIDEGHGNLVFHALLGKL